MGKVRGGGAGVLLERVGGVVEAEVGVGEEFVGLGILVVGGKKLGEDDPRFGEMALIDESAGGFEGDLGGKRWGHGEEQCEDAEEAGQGAISGLSRRRRVRSA